jgi:hypothetical protein
MGNINSNSLEEEGERKEILRELISEAVENELLLIYYEKMKIIEYDKKFNKWIGFIFMGDYKHIIGYYDTWQEAINKVLDKIEMVFGETENRPCEIKLISLINLRKNKNYKK